MQRSHLKNCTNTNIDANKIGERSILFFFFFLIHGLHENEGYLLLIGLPFANEAIQFRVNTIYSLAWPVFAKEEEEEKKDKQRNEK